LKMHRYVNFSAACKSYLWIIDNIWPQVFFVYFDRPLPPEPFQEPWDDPEEVSDVDDQVEDKSITDLSQVEIFNLDGMHLLDQVNFVRFSNQVFLYKEAIHRMVAENHPPTQGLF
jgi:hypothetical protein